MFRDLTPYGWSVLMAFFCGVAVGLGFALAVDYWVR